LIGNSTLFSQWENLQRLGKSQLMKSNTAGLDICAQPKKKKNRKEGGFEGTTEYKIK
jgi:hypothetical protein